MKSLRKLRFIRSPYNHVLSLTTKIPSMARLFISCQMSTCMPASNYFNNDSVPSSLLKLSWSVPTILQTCKKIKRNTKLARATIMFNLKPLIGFHLCTFHTLPRIIGADWQMGRPIFSNIADHDVMHSSDNFVERTKKLHQPVVLFLLAREDPKLDAISLMFLCYVQYNQLIGNDGKKLIVSEVTK